MVVFLPELSVSKIIFGCSLYIKSVYFLINKQLKKTLVAFFFRGYTSGNNKWGAVYVRGK